NGTSRPTIFQRRSSHPPPAKQSRFGRTFISAAFLMLSRNEPKQCSSTNRPFRWATTRAMPRTQPSEAFANRSVPRRQHRLHSVNENLHKLESILGYSFRRPELLERAVTHSSAAHERKLSDLDDNEQMEFLGDSLVGFFISDFLFREHTSLSEGELSK